MQSLETGVLLLRFLYGVLIVVEGIAGVLTTKGPQTSLLGLGLWMLPLLLEQLMNDDFELVQRGVGFSERSPGSTNSPPSPLLSMVRW
jgi:hypothetical protein